MATKIVPQGEPSKSGIDEAQVQWLGALIANNLGTVEPSLGDGPAKVEPPRTVVRFPWALKRGAKVKRGPRASILPFPVQLSEVELDDRFRWIRSNAGNWENVETEGVEHASEEQRQFAKAVRVGYGLPPLTDADKRRRIAEGRAHIEKRNRVKAWLASLGADPDKITTPEQALFFAFDRMHSRDLPPGA